MAIIIIIIIIIIIALYCCKRNFMSNENSNSTGHWGNMDHRVHLSPCSEHKFVTNKSLKCVVHAADIEFVPTT